MLERRQEHGGTPKLRMACYGWASPKENEHKGTVDSPKSSPKSRAVGQDANLKEAPVLVDIEAPKAGSRPQVACAAWVPRGPS